MAKQVAPQGAQSAPQAPVPAAPVPPPAPAKAARVNAYGYPLGIPRTGPLALAAMQNRANVLAVGLAAGTYGTPQSAAGAAPGTTYAGAYQHYTASVAWCAAYVRANPTCPSVTPAVHTWLAVHHAPTRKAKGPAAA